MTIKFVQDTFIKELKTVKQALEALQLAEPPGSCGKNNLSYTAKFQSREQKTHNMLDEYKKNVHKNIKDVKNNCNLLKEKDLELARKAIGRIIDEFK
ncbi:DUF5344 family protein [Bacillus sp. CLL-7-23]|uniref:DUF5344 family protein n=1 Tax=Bacillus changyiensis TaxID=3004103 RepID=A0ABT4X605_9BACI|nr:DUF5344 family protein [Bacillus changyiensis]MDA1477253.1 DUF5344 family protein [Bacillus changyiensis]MDA7026856.1 DUF5344 family protein [Bacillus changyiensis]